jgi:hypothetical protein
MSSSTLDAPRKRVRPCVGPHSRQHQLLAGLDWRTREGKFLAAARDELTRHVGGSPNSVQRTPIERAARLTLYIEMMDRDSLVAGTMSERNSRHSGVGQRASPVFARDRRRRGQARASAEPRRLSGDQGRRAMIDIVEALDDPNLFGPWFSGPSWSTWKAVLKGAFAIPMDAGKLKARSTTV